MFENTKVKVDPTWAMLETHVKKNPRVMPANGEQEVVTCILFFGL